MICNPRCKNTKPLLSKQRNKQRPQQLARSSQTLDVDELPPPRQPRTPHTRTRSRWSSFRSAI